MGIHFIEFPDERAAKQSLFSWLLVQFLVPHLFSYVRGISVAILGALGDMVKATTDGSHAVTKDA